MSVLLFWWLGLFVCVRVCLRDVRKRDWNDVYVILWIFLYVFYICKLDSLADLIQICNQSAEFVRSTNTSRFPVTVALAMWRLCAHKWARQYSLIKIQIMLNTVVLVLLALLRCVINLWSQWVLKQWCIQIFYLNLRPTRTCTSVIMDGAENQIWF